MPTRGVTTILLARHGQTDWNRQRRWQGVADLPLNQHGREEARTLAEILEARPCSAIYSSDLRRAYETALIVAKQKTLAVSAIPDLREIDVGSWTGLSRHDVKKQFPDAYQEWKNRTGRGWDGGETYEEMGCRVLEALRSIARKHTGSEVLVVTHSGPIRTICAHARGLSYASDRKAVPTVGHVELSAVTVVDDVFRPVEAPLFRPSDAAKQPLP